MNFKQHKLKLSVKIRYYLLGLILIGTASAMSNFFHWGMIGLSGFLLAYLGKGMRRVKESE